MGETLVYKYTTLSVEFVMAVRMILSLLKLHELAPNSIEYFNSTNPQSRILIERIEQLVQNNGLPVG